MEGPHEGSSVPVDITISEGELDRVIDSDGVKVDSLAMTVRATVG